MIVIDYICATEDDAGELVNLVQPFAEAVDFVEFFEGRIQSMPTKIVGGQAVAPGRLVRVYLNGLREEQQTLLLSIPAFGLMFTHISPNKRNARVSDGKNVPSGVINGGGSLLTGKFQWGYTERLMGKKGGPLAALLKKDTDHMKIFKAFARRVYAAQLTDENIALLTSQRLSWEFLLECTKTIGISLEAPAPLPEPLKT